MPIVVLFSCSLESRPVGRQPIRVSDRVRHDSDDPAIWINSADPSASLILGTDKESDRRAMGIGLYKRPSDGEIFAIVSRKSGPSGSYLWQYRLHDDGTGQVVGTHVRSFGLFSGSGEIEA
ncbi:MAG: phytase, partial [Spirochaetaceae bacterium]